MAAKPITEILREFSLLLGAAGDAAGSAAVHGFADSLASAGDRKAKAIVTKVQAHWKAAAVEPHSNKLLRARLERLNTLLASANAKPAGDVSILLKLLEAPEPMGVTDFCASIRDAILAPNPSKSKSKPKPEPLSDTDIKRLADNLTRASQDQAQFEAALSGLPSLSLGDFSAVATHYLGYAAKGSKKEVEKKIRSRQLQDAIEGSRQRRLERIAV